MPDGTQLWKIKADGSVLKVTDIPDGGAGFFLNVLDIGATQPGNSAPVVTGSVTLAAIAEDSGARLITQGELLANASDADHDPLHGNRTDNNERTRHARRQSRRHLELYACGERRHVGVILLHGERWRAVGRRHRHAGHSAGARMDSPAPPPSGTANRPQGDDYTVTAARPPAMPSTRRGGIDSIVFDFQAFIDAHVTYVDNQVIIDGPASRTVVSGFEIFSSPTGR